VKAALLQLGTEEHLVFYCPGCRCDHGVPVRHSNMAWTWNGSLEKPTLSPSILVRYGRDPRPDLPQTCHSFVRDGRIEFLTDCYHELAGQTVELRDYEEANPKETVPLWPKDPPVMP